VLCISTITLREFLDDTESSAQQSPSPLAVKQFWIRAEPARLGMPSGAYDMLIGAHRRSEGLMHLTYNVRKFQRISGLRIDNWV